MISLKNVSKSYDGQIIFSDYSADFSGDIVCILAPSGRGKTSLLRMIMGLENPDAGVIETGGSMISPVFQENRLLEWADAYENIRFVMGSDYEEEACRQMFLRLGLTEIQNKPVRDFSGGMKRRLALARALIKPSGILVLDEPFAGLDPDTRQEVIRVILDYRNGRQVVLVTHDPEDATRLGCTKYQGDGQLELWERRDD